MLAADSAQCADAKMLIATWYLRVLDAHGRTTTIPFDNVEGSAPLLIGLDIKRHSDTVNRAEPSCIASRRPTDTPELSFRIYIRDYLHRNARLRMELVISNKSTISSMM